MPSPSKGKKLSIPNKPKRLTKKKTVPSKIGAKKKTPARTAGPAVESAPPPAKPVPAAAPAAPPLAAPPPTEPRQGGQTTQQVPQTASGSHGRPIPQAAVAPPAPAFPVSQPSLGQDSYPARHIGSLREQTRQQPALTRSESEEFQEQVGLYWELCDSLLGGAKLEAIADLLHLLVCSLNLDVVSLVMLDANKPKKLNVVANRGYKTSPNPSVVACWEGALKDGSLDWSKLMKSAGDKDNDLAYWVVYEGLQFVGYVPIRDSARIYGFLLVGAHDKDQKPSPLASNLLDACGSRIGLAQAEASAAKGGGRNAEKQNPAQSMLPDQLSRIKRALKDLKKLDMRFQKDLASVAYECDKAIVDMEQSLEGGRG